MNKIDKIQILTKILMRKIPKENSNITIILQEISKKLIFIKIR